MAKFYVVHRETADSLPFTIGEFDGLQKAISFLNEKSEEYSNNLFVTTEIAMPKRDPNTGLYRL